MNRVAAVVFAITAAPWSATALAVPSWWESPAFGRMGLPLWTAGLMWGVSALVMTAMTAGAALRVSIVAAALSVYAVPTTLAGVSIVTFTVEANAVSAMGSAIAWLGLAFGAWYRLSIIARVS